MLKGIFTPIVTPFNEMEEIDYPKMAHNLNKWGQTGLDGVVVLGTNGEFPYIDPEEKAELIRFVVNNFNPDKKVIAGTGCETTRDTIALCTEAAEAGVHAVLVLPPHYYKGSMSEEVLYEHYIETADNSPVPLLIYNMPKNTGINLSVGLVARLSQHPNIVGIKDTAGNIVQLAELVRDTADGFSVFAGNAGYLLPALAVGAVAPLPLPQTYCRTMRQVVDLFNQGKLEEAGPAAKTFGAQRPGTFKQEYRHLKPPWICWATRAACQGVRLSRWGLKKGNSKGCPYKVRCSKRRRIITGL